MFSSWSVESSLIRVYAVAFIPQSSVMFPSTCSPSGNVPSSGEIATKKSPPLGILGRKSGDKVS
jgi:hypothetical protein